MITLKASVAAAILVGTIAASAGATYFATKATVTVSCAQAPTALPPSRPDLPTGQLPPLRQGKKF